MAAMIPLKIRFLALILATACLPAAWSSGADDSPPPTDGAAAPSDTPPPPAPADASAATTQPVIAEPGPAPAGQVMRFQALQQNAGGDATGNWLLATTDDNLPVRLLLPAGDDSAGSLANAKPGMLLDVTADKPTNQITALKAYSANPAEFANGVYVFAGTRPVTVGSEAAVSVSLKKLGVEYPVLVPNHTGDDGKTTPDADLTARIAALKQNELVFVHLQKQGIDGPTLISIEPYLPPQSGQLLAATSVDIDEFGSKTPGVKIQQGDDEHVFPFATLDAGGKAVAKIDLGLPAKYVPGDQINLYFRQVGDLNEVKEMDFDGDITRSGENELRFQIPTALLVVTEAGRQIAQAQLIVMDKPTDGEKLMAGLKRTFPRWRFGSARLNSAGAELGLTSSQISSLLQLMASMPAAPYSDDDLDEIKGLANNFRAASSADARRAMGQQVFWALNHVVIRRRNRFDALEQDAKSILTPSQYQAILSGGGDLPEVADASTQPSDNNNNNPQNNDNNNPQNNNANPSHQPHGGFHHGRR